MGITVLQLNSTINSGSHGRIAEEIGKILISRGNKSIVGFGRHKTESQSEVFPIGTKKDIYLHLLKTRMFDRHGFGSLNATKLLVSKIDLIAPDIIQLHNVHGYFLNIEILFDYLRNKKIPIVWTFHDCWPFTGHCSFFDRPNCERWKSECFNCPLKRKYPSSWFIDNSRNNFKRKKAIFTGIENMTLVSPSSWLARHLENSFLHEYPVKIINNGVDLEKFKPTDSAKLRTKFGIESKHIILGVANIWDERKGLIDFINLRSILDSGIVIILVGLSPGQLRNLPDGIRGITKTENIEELVELYSAADVFINPTYVDNFPSVNIEALACGTPVVTYDTGGSPESINSGTGRTVSKGNIMGLKSAALDLIKENKQTLSMLCRKRAEHLYDAKDRFSDYLSLYELLAN